MGRCGGRPNRQRYGRFDARFEKRLSDGGGHDGAANHHRHQDRILVLIDVAMKFPGGIGDTVGQAEQNA